ncbi:glycogen debranching enzyme, putative [Desulfocicer vacuolatum DSM 3385]|uniref:Glycogen debranching enzyme, putative n=1 Tax=Desulfocicer vacuolatum DSM 3385 TaxID=1121400 RepID=A0A1W2DU85_9BACT|nr:amylo-alpha-1,6-glucosidase [Desulfocicer vacuolatum]SMD00947.1 glycogen debranching enzyme, putative [Desulfocicer vacuolatum DSM 3385]
MVVQYPEPGRALVMFCGDSITFTLELASDTDVGGDAFIRTNLGRAWLIRQEIIDRVDKGEIKLNSAWHDIKMIRRGPASFSITLPLYEPGHFKAKCFFMGKADSSPLWPGGENTVINVESAGSCCANIIYNAFVRQFGSAKWPREPMPPEEEKMIHTLESKGYTVIPESGKFRDLVKEVDFIFGELGCRVLQLLPVHPTPTTYARMGRYGSPYAALNFTDVDPALVAFDPLATPLEQFMELADAVHTHCGYLILDIAINHTGWAATIHESHPEWLVRKEDGTIEVPGAWGVKWEDLTKLDYSRVELWQYMADIFLCWCRRRVDGFRCDAGYMIPLPAWEYIVARVRNEYPDTLFFLEGLGGGIHATCDLLNTANLNWAYSELFQNYRRTEIENYLLEALEISEKYGLMVHFAETHDNPRLAAVSHTYARMRTAVSALFSVCGGFGFSAGVEWFATEKINVHQAPSLNWGATDNQIEHIKRLNLILKHHPTFSQGTRLFFIHNGPDNGLALARIHDNSHSGLLIVVNLDCEHKETVSWNSRDWEMPSSTMVDLLTERNVHITTDLDQCSVTLAPGQVMALSSGMENLHAWMDNAPSLCRMPRRVLDQKLKAKAMKLFQVFQGFHDLGDFDVHAAAEHLVHDPVAFCRSLNLEGKQSRMVTWNWDADRRRTVMVPPGHCVLVLAHKNFRADIRQTLRNSVKTVGYEEALPMASGHFFAVFPPLKTNSFHRELTFRIRLFQNGKTHEHNSSLLFLAQPRTLPFQAGFSRKKIMADPSLKFLDVNGRGAVLRAAAWWGRLESRYDGLLCANLNPEYPENRWMLLARYRIWALYQGTSRELTLDCLETFSCLIGEQGGLWRFNVPTSEGRHFIIELKLWMVRGQNQVCLEIIRKPSRDVALFLDDDLPVTLIIRPDIEDRSFHDTVKAWTGPENAWESALTLKPHGVRFEPAPGERCLDIEMPGEKFELDPEWTYMVHRPLEESRGLDAHSDLFSPGYFKIAMTGSLQGVLLRADADGLKPPDGKMGPQKDPTATASVPSNHFIETVARNLDHYMVSRGRDKSVIAGYPWFLDWGRDSLIFCRALIQAGRLDYAKAVLRLFGQYEQGGTLPNMICGSNAENRETSDAPLWFFATCRELVEQDGDDFLHERLGNRSVTEILISMGRSLIHGTDTGVIMDGDTALLYSPSHFTWMDTNFPAGTPRQGYPVEIQALWHYALCFLARIDGDSREPAWKELALKVKHNVHHYYFLKEKGYFSDCLHAEPGTGAAQARPDDALRPNQLFVLTLGVLDDPSLTMPCLEACMELLVPGAIRSLADRPVSFPLPIESHDGILNDPYHPYAGVYEGDEDTQRKPAYHNGTAWTWPFPVFCEAWAGVYDDPQGRETALALLGSASELMKKGCVGHLPEVLDGDYPHTPRGCDAQAWGTSELYRVWIKLDTISQKGRLK